MCLKHALGVPRGCAHVAAGSCASRLDPIGLSVRIAADEAAAAEADRARTLPGPRTPLGSVAGSHPASLQGPTDSPSDSAVFPSGVGQRQMGEYFFL